MEGRKNPGRTAAELRGLESNQREQAYETRWRTNTLPAIGAACRRNRESQKEGYSPIHTAPRTKYEETAPLAQSSLRLYLGYVA